MSSVAALSSATAVNFVCLPQATSSHLPAIFEDVVNLYAVKLLTIKLPWYGFHDTVKKGIW